MLRDLTAYLRHSLDGINQTVVTVDAEVGGLVGLSPACSRRASAIASGPRSHVDPAAASRRIASFLLQPLVENAVKHGKRDNGLDVGVDIRAVGDALHVEIENTGSLEAPRGVAPAPSRDRPRERAPAARPALSRPPQLHARDRGRGPNKVVATLCWKANRAGPDRRRRASGAPGDAAPAGRRIPRSRSSAKPRASTEALRGHRTQPQPQLVFLDIELGGGDGFDLLAALERPPIVVFVTAYAEHAVEAFAVNAVDYLLKPVEPERLAELLARAERQLAPRRPRRSAARDRASRRRSGPCWPSRPRSWRCAPTAISPMSSSPISRR